MNDEEVCGFTEEEQPDIENTVQLGGRDITAEGTVRALVLFIDFSDDTVDTNNIAWSVGEGPTYIDDIIDPEEGGQVKQHNIASFLADNSFDQFIMVGDTIYPKRPIMDLKNFFYIAFFRGGGIFRWLKNGEVSLMRMHRTESLQKII